MHHSSVLFHLSDASADVVKADVDGYTKGVYSSALRSASTAVLQTHVARSSVENTEEGEPRVIRYGGTPSHSRHHLLPL